MDHNIFWNKIASHYDRETEKIYGDAYKETFEEIKKYLKPGTKVVDIGCGTGTIEIEIGKMVSKIIAIDPSSEMINIAKRKTEEAGIKNIEYKNSKLEEEAKNPQKYEIIIASNVLHFFIDINTTLKVIKDSLTDDGVFISVTDCLGEKMSVKTFLTKVASILKMVPFINYYTVEELKAKVIENGFEIIKDKNLYTNPPNYLIVAVKR